MFDRDPIEYIIILSIVLPSLTVHEFAHAYLAYIFGDNTAKSMGRLTLNPIAHIDLFGTIILPLLVPIGYAKPVPVNFTILNRAQILLVAIAGPISNIILALILTFAYHLLTLEFDSTLEFILWKAIQLNIVFAVFNLIPIPPLDGSRIIYASLKSEKALRIYRSFSGFGFFILLGLLVFGGFGLVIYPIIEGFLKLLKLPL